MYVDTYLLLASTVFHVPPYNELLFFNTLHVALTTFYIKSSVALIFQTVTIDHTISECIFFLQRFSF